MKNCIILIPTLNPNVEFIYYVRELVNNGFKLIIIDDGSSSEYKHIFSEIEKDKENVFVYRHAINLGKGRALKDGFNMFLCLYSEDKDIKGIITVDSDGQHAVKDVLQMDEIMGNKDSRFVLGSRQFDDACVPWKSKFGNKMTRTVMKLLHGINVEDTQTGLRGISKDILGTIMELQGERFEYETNMIIEIARRNIRIQEMPIETIYIDENSETHFNPIRDSIAIYRLIFQTFFKYICSSLASCILDLGAFQIVFNFLKRCAFEATASISVATVIARIISSLFNYTVNKNVVFGESCNRGTFWKYYLLCVVQMCCSALGVIVLTCFLHIPEIVIKGIVDTVLFFISFRIQKKYIFRKEL